jgi:hypothetical protein
MCGAEVDRRGDCLVDKPVHSDDALKAVAIMTSWAISQKHFVLLRIVSVYVHNPHATVRQVADMLGMKKTQAGYYIKEAANRLPILKTLRSTMRQKTTRARAQSARRARVCN